MSFLAAIPVIGQLFTTVEKVVDELHVSDEERLVAKKAIMEVASPALEALLKAQSEFDQLAFRLREIELTSGDWFVRRTRPAMMWLTFLAWVGVEGYLSVHGGLTQASAERAFYAFGLIGGLFSATRGIEKAVDKWTTNGKTK